MSRILALTQNPAKVVLVMALVFGVMTSLLVPQMLASDENAHFLKAYAITSGNLSSESCSFPDSVLHKANALLRNDLTNDLAIGQPTESTTNGECGAASGYVPIMHLPQAVGIGAGRLLGGSPSTLVLMGRLANAIFYALALFWIVKFVNNRKWVFAAIGLLPTAVHTAGTLSGDVMNNIVVLGSLAFIYNLLGQKRALSLSQTIAIYVMAAGLILTKAPNILLMLPLLALPAHQFTRISGRLTPKARKWLVIISSITLAVILFLVWQKLYGSMLYRDIPTTNPLVAHPLHFVTVMFNTYLSPGLGYGDMVIRGMIGDFASFSYHLPAVLIIIEILLIVFVLLEHNPEEPLAARKAQTTMALLSVIALAAFVTAITYALYTAWSILPVRLGPNAAYADGVQGRYFTAALILLVPIASYIRSYASIHLVRQSTVGLAVSLVSFVCLSFYILETYATFT